MAIFETDYSKGRTRLYEETGRPDKVLRMPIPVAEITDARVERDKKFAELLVELDEKYGIHSPNMSLFQTQNGHGAQEAFIEGQKVVGKNLSDEADAIPATVIRDALEAILAYYKNATVNGGAYLTDLRPSNVIYGHAPNDETDRLYFVDLEPLWDNNQPGHPLGKIYMDNVLPELMFLITELKRNGQTWEDLSTALQELEDLQKPEVSMAESETTPRASSFKTEKGSVYTYDAEGKSARFKAATGEQKRRTDLTVFVNLTPEQKGDFIDAIYAVSVNPDRQRLVQVLERQPDNMGKFIKDVSEVKDPNNLLLAIFQDNKVIGYVPASLTPEIGANVFEMRNIEQNGQKMVERHLGDRVTEITYAK